MTPRDLEEIPAQYVNGVGPRRAELLSALGIETVRDLLRHYPRRYDDRRQIRRIAQLEPGAEETVRGKVMAAGGRRARPTLALFQIAVSDGSGTVYATWFNQPYLKSVFRVGQEVILTGKAQRRARLELLSPEYEILDGKDDELLNAGRIVPVYCLCENLTQRALRRIMDCCLDAYAADAPEMFDPARLGEIGLCAMPEALRNIHFPESPAALERARRRLVFDEFLPMQLALALKKRQIAELPGVPRVPGEGKLFAGFSKSLPFCLTGAQRRAIREIRADMERRRPMNRLLQGDVGSGKTVVAVAAILTALDAGSQAALMAPTELLAEQHWRTISGLLASLGVRPLLLISDMGAAEKREAHDRIGSGAPAVVVGTHALIQKEISFPRLGLVIVDEQHRFGVAQRARLRGKGMNPDVMVMTATPIPRTLALSMYGDLDVSVLDEMPAGRGSVTTRWVPEEKLPEAYASIRAEALKGGRAYIVYPLIDRSDRLPLAAAVRMADTLQKEHFRDVAVGLVHGRMPRGEREDVMKRFREGDIRILVATSVIEVGLDVPEARVMLVAHAERFGLSQLHQMRGRVGRGPGKSLFLFSAKPDTEDARKRLRALCTTADGFRIAEMDLELRGPGEFFSARQHGGPDLRIADIRRDEGLLRLARESAERIAGEDRFLKRQEHAFLRKLLVRNYRGRFLLGTVA